MALRGQSEGIVERVVTVLLASQGGDVLLRSQFWPLFGALASFMDSDLDEVLEALESALRGEPTALRELLAHAAQLRAALRALLLERAEALRARGLLPLRLLPPSEVAKAPRG